MLPGTQPNQFSTRRYPLPHVHGVSHRNDSLGWTEEFGSRPVRLAAIAKGRPHQLTASRIFLSGT